MTDEDFLARWSRRKRAAEDAKQAEPPDHAAPPDAEAMDVAPGQGEQDQKQPDVEAFDPASLPPVESITAATDVTAFLRKGVPPELTRAALRRAWVSDPAIRDFIGLAENSWDFNDPTAIPGFGPLEQTPEQVRRMLSGLLNDVQHAADEVAEHLPRSADDHGQAATTAEISPDVAVASEFAAAQHVSARVNADEHESAGFPHAAGVATDVPDDARDTASQHNDSSQPGPRPRRSHGSALPQ
jgi:hypothetical protein